MSGVAATVSQGYCKLVSWNDVEWGRRAVQPTDSKRRTVVRIVEGRWDQVRAAAEAHFGYHDLVEHVVDRDARRRFRDSKVRHNPGLRVPTPHMALVGYRWPISSKPPRPLQPDDFVRKGQWVVVDHVHLPPHAPKYLPPSLYDAVRESLPGKSAAFKWAFPYRPVWWRSVKARLSTSSTDPVDGNVTVRPVHWSDTPEGDRGLLWDAYMGTAKAAFDIAGVPPTREELACDAAHDGSLVYDVPAHELGWAMAHPDEECDDPFAGIPQAQRAKFRAGVRAAKRDGEGPLREKLEARDAKHESCRAVAVTLSSEPSITFLDLFAVSDAHSDV